MKIERAGDLIHWTYRMIDWERAKQMPSDQVCAQCGSPMKSVEAVTDRRGASYDGVVCHSCKRVIWVRSG